MPHIFNIGKTLDYQGYGFALAAVTGGQIVGLTYLRDALPYFDDAEGPTAAADAINDPRIGPTVRELSARGEVFVGMCSCWEFVVL